MTTATKKAGKSRPKIQQPISPDNSQIVDTEDLGFGDILIAVSPRETSAKNATATGNGPRQQAGTTASLAPAPPPSQSITDLTPNSSNVPWWKLFNCCCLPTPPSSELRKTIDELTRRNQELEACVASLSMEKLALKSRLGKEKKKKTEAKERRSTFKNKLAHMSAKLKEDFGDDYDEFEGSLLSDASFASK